EKIKDFTDSEINLIELGKTVTIGVNGDSFEISKDDVEILSEQISGWIVESENGVTVAVDTEISAQLLSEGMAREFVNRVQNMRKDAGFQVTDKINIEFLGNSDFVLAISSFANYISGETLADKIKNIDKLEGGFIQDQKIGGDEIKIKIEKVSI
ncbi:MAG: DUF5915 domain-containing protein, partial [Ignavibacteriaceae bacterium]|nr:DUF5915 domain-containing protein [Ignavibacteriaceae bacterium]